MTKDLEEKAQSFLKLLKIMDELREQCPWDKKQTIESIRHLTIEETYELSDAILKGNADEIKKELIAVKGIGNWTAEMFLMFTLGREDIFPADDLGINNGLTKLLKKPLTRLKLEEFAMRWKPYRTVASWYIWASLDNR